MTCSPAPWMKDLNITVLMTDKNKLPTKAHT